MMSAAPQWIFLVLGPAFLVAGFVRCVGSGRVGPQARTWLILGVLFSLVAAWLWTMQPPPR